MDMRVSNTDAQIKLGDMPSLNHCVRLTFGVRNPLTRELANWLIWLNSGDSTESGEHEQYSGSPEHKQCLGSPIIRSGCIEENQHIADLQDSTRNPDLAYFSNQQVNRLSLRELDNNPEIIGAVHSMGGYEIFVGQPFGSIPRTISSRRASSFNQLARLVPSLSASVSNCVLSSGLMRMWNGGAFPLPFGCRSLLIVVDMCTPIGLAFKLIGVHLITVAAIKTTPPKGITSTRRGLTTNVIDSNEVAMLNHTPTRFKFLFLAVHRSDVNAKPHRESVTAHSEQDARRSLAGQFVLSFAGRLPEVSHA